MDPRPLVPDDAPALLPLLAGLAAHHGDPRQATVRSLVRDLSDGWVWGFGAGTPLAAYVLMHRHVRVQDGSEALICTMSTSPRRPGGADWLPC